MFENISIRSSVAVLLQIENLVQFAVASGKLKAGDQLPSVRELPEKLKLNPNTVAKSYRDLEVKGLVYTWRGVVRCVRSAQLLVVIPARIRRRLWSNHRGQNALSRTKGRTVLHMDLYLSKYLADYASDLKISGNLPESSGV